MSHPLWRRSVCAGGNPVTVTGSAGGIDRQRDRNGDVQRDHLSATGTEAESARPENRMERRLPDRSVPMAQRTGANGFLTPIVAMSAASDQGAPGPVAFPVCWAVGPMSLASRARARRPKTLPIPSRQTRQRRRHAKATKEDGAQRGAARCRACHALGFSGSAPAKLYGPNSQMFQYCPYTNTEVRPLPLLGHRQAAKSSSAQRKCRSSTRSPCRAATAKRTQKSFSELIARPTAYALQNRPAGSRRAGRPGQLQRNQQLPAADQLRSDLRKRPHRPQLDP